MPEKLKNIFFTIESIRAFGDEIHKNYPKFDRKTFENILFSEDWESKELKEKMRHTTLCLHEVLPDNYGRATDILMKSAHGIKGFEAMTLPDYVEVYGMEDWELSLTALGHFTRFSSSEFAIRPFLAKDPERVMSHMSWWAEDEHENVRRFASEGCRPRLPWAMALPKFKKDPALIFPVLEKLKDDVSEFVRRSVANNLNDISKDNPDLMLNVCEKWYGKTENTDRIVKHACRSLLKAGNKRALMIFGYGDPALLSVKELKLSSKTVHIGEYLHFSFQLQVPGDKAVKIRLEYRVDFMKAKGKQSKKVFKITENTYKPGTHSFKRKQSFADMSTRKHYEGEHGLTICVNGEEKFSATFHVKK